MMMMSVVECEEQIKQCHPTQGQGQTIEALITECEINTVFICIKAGLKYTQGLKYMPGSAAE